MSASTRDPRAAHPSLWDYAACYGLWAVVLALAFVALWAWRTAIEVLVSAFVGPRGAFAAVYIMGILLAGLLVLVGVLLSEAYLRSALDWRYGEPAPYRGRRRLVERFARLAALLLLATVLAVAVQVWTVWHVAPQPGSTSRRSPPIPPPPDALVPPGG